jgi:hypothetical protein
MENEYMYAFKRLAPLFPQIHWLLTFERRLSRRTKIMLGILAISMWLGTPMALKLMVISSHCVNLGLGLLIHGAFLYRKPKMVAGFTLNLNRHMTIALGTMLFLCGVISRKVIL